MELTKENYVDTAEKVMKEICCMEPKKIVTTSKIRNILGMISDIYNDVRHISGDKLDSDMIGRIQYLKLHVVYEAGREKSVKILVDKAGLLPAINSIGSSKEQLILFCHYMEALVAYRKYLGGRDE